MSPSIISVGFGADSQLGLSALFSQKAILFFYYMKHAEETCIYMNEMAVGKDTFRS